MKPFRPYRIEDKKVRRNFFYTKHLRGKVEPSKTWDDFKVLSPKEYRDFRERLENDSRDASLEILYVEKDKHRKILCYGPDWLCVNTTVRLLEEFPDEMRKAEICTDLVKVPPMRLRAAAS